MVIKLHTLSYDFYSSNEGKPVLHAFHVNPAHIVSISHYHKYDLNKLKKYYNNIPDTMKGVETWVTFVNGQEDPVVEDYDYIKSMMEKC